MFIKTLMFLIPTNCTTLTPQIIQNNHRVLSKKANTKSKRKKHIINMVINMLTGLLIIIIWRYLIYNYLPAAVTNNINGKVCVCLVPNIWS